MKKFFGRLQVDTEHKELAGVCAGLGNTSLTFANIVRFQTVCCFLPLTEIGIIAVNLSCLSSRLAWQCEPLRWSKKLETKLFSLLAVCLILVSLGTEA